MKTFILPLLFAPAALVAAELFKLKQMVTLSGKTYEQISVTKVTAVDVKFTHAGGVATVALTDLTPEMQRFLGYDPVAADFEMINRQEERRRELIDVEKKKAEYSATLARQKAEHEAIKAIEAKGIKLSLAVREIKDDAATCVALRFRLVAMDGRSINGKKVPAKKKMSGEYEMAEEAVPLAGANPNDVVTLVVVHGLDKPVVGQQLAKVVYPWAFNQRGFATDYAADASLAYTLAKKKSATP